MSSENAPRLARAKKADLSDLAPKTADLRQFKLSLREWETADLADLADLYW